MNNKAYLVLEDGHIFEGKSFGVIKPVTAEVVFATGMTGYLETLTDPSYYGQMVVQTFPLIGNYGVISADFESLIIGPSAYIVKSWCQDPSNFRSEGNIDIFFKEKGVTGLYDIDTRSLTKIIREKGVMNGRIVYSLDDIDYNEIKEYKIIEAVKNVSVKEMKTTKAKKAKRKVVLIDCGFKGNIVKELVKRDCDVLVVPYDINYEQIKDLKPDGIMISNGPGNPEENVKTINTIKELMTSDIPVFGICLGHQLVALANGFKTEKLKYGHRGGNQPVKNLESGRVYITSQNHGYAVVSDSIDERFAKEQFVNVNDKTNEGVKYLNAPVFTVQFHPEACGGPKDTEELFDYFIDMMEVNKHATRS